MPPKQQCVRGAQCKRPKEHIICCIGSAFPELVRLQQENAGGLPALDPPLPGKQEPHSAKLSELKEDALRRATCLSGASGQRCEFHASCEDVHRDAHKSYDKRIIIVHKCREPQEYTVKDPELGGEERLVRSHESHVYHRAYIKRTLDHLLCGPCWERHARNSGLKLVAYPPANAGAQQNLAEKRELSHASKKARTGVHYLVQSTGDDGNGQHAAIIRSTHRGSQLDMDELTRDLLQQHDSTWEQDIMPMIGRFQRATQLRRAPRQQRSSTFAHAPPARQGAALTSGAPPCPAAPRAPAPNPIHASMLGQQASGSSQGAAPYAPAPNPIHASMLGQQASGSSQGAAPQPTPLVGTAAAPHQHMAAHATGLAPSGTHGSAGASQHTGAAPQPTPLAGTAAAPHQHMAATQATGLDPSSLAGLAGASQHIGSAPFSAPFAGAAAAPHQSTTARTAGLTPSCLAGLPPPSQHTGAAPQPASLLGAAAAAAAAAAAPCQHMGTNAAGLTPSGLAGFAGASHHTGDVSQPAPFAGTAAAPHELIAAQAIGLALSSQHTGLPALPGVPNRNVPPRHQPPIDEYAHAISNSLVGRNPLRQDSFKRGVPIPNFYELQQAPRHIPNHMDAQLFINKGIMSAMCGLVEDISGGMVCCLDPDCMEKLCKGEHVLERVPSNWQFICLPWQSNLNRDGGDAFVPVWRMLVVDRTVKTVQIYCSRPRGRGQPAQPPELRGGAACANLMMQLEEAGIQDAHRFDWRLHWAQTGCASDPVNSGIYIMSFLHLLYMRIPSHQWGSYCQDKENALRRQAGLSLLHNSAMCFSPF